MLAFSIFYINRDDANNALCRMSRMKSSCELGLIPKRGYRRRNMTRYMLCTSADIAIDDSFPHTNGTSVISGRMVAEDRLQAGVDQIE